MITPSYDVVESRLRHAVEEFLKRDLHLLTVRTSERSMCHRLAGYLEPLFPTWHLDCEYNRDGKEPKQMPLIPYGPDRSVLPDIIIHRRGIPENLLVLEAKCSDASSSDANDDRGKLIAYRSELAYWYSAFVTFHVCEQPHLSFELEGSDGQRSQVTVGNGAPPVV